MSWVSDALDDVGDAARGAVDSVGNSLGNIVDSGGDFVRALGRGDFGGAASDLLSIGWESLNVVSFGLLNQAADYVRGALLPEIPPIDYQDRKVMSRSASEPRRIVYGTTRTGGVIRYMESSGTDSEYMHIIVIFAAHSCQQIQRVYFDDELALIGNTPQGKYVNYLLAVGETGKQTGANSTIVSNTPSGWTSNHKLLGQTYMYFRLKYDTEIYNGLPNIDALIVGKDDIYDPRTGTTGYTDNQALVVRDYLSSDYGYGVTDFDEQSFIDGANICDQNVTTGGGNTEDRYTVNGTISVVSSPADSLNALLAAGASSIQPVEGKVRYIPGIYQAPAAGADFDESDLFGGLQFTPLTSASDRFNSVRGTYIDPRQEYEVVDFVPYQVSGYITKDKQELWQDSRFPYTNSGTMARRIAKIMLERARFGVRASCTLGWRALEYSEGDRITLSISGLGWSSKVFRIERMELSLNGVNVELAEDSSDVWDWVEGDALEIDVPPALNLPDPTVVTAPTGLSVSETLFYAADQRTVKNRTIISWDGIVTVSRWELQGSYNGGSYVTLSDYLTAPYFEHNEPELGGWIYRVRAVNGVGFKSGYSSIAFTALGKQAPPSNVANFTGTIRPFAIEFEWNQIADLDLDFYELRLGATWDSATPLQKIYATRWTWETRPTGPENVLIKAVDTSGNYSTLATQAYMVISDPASPVVTQQVIDNNVLLRWQDSTTSFALKWYEVRRGATYAGSELIGNVTSTFTTIFETQAGTYKYWVKAVDIAGNESSPVAIEAIVDQPPDFVLLTNQQVDFSTGTLTNMTLENGGVIGPVNTAETWAQHFTNNSWSTPQDQIGAGFPVYIQPTPASGSAEVIIDLLSVLSTGKIKLSSVVDVLDGSPTHQWTLGYSEDDVTYTDAVATEVFASDFRYIKVRIDVTSASGQDLLQVVEASIQVDVKIRTDQGSGTADSADAGGTPVTFNYAFADITSIVVTPNSTSQVTAVYDFTDAPNPTGFDVYLFDNAGNRVSGDFSWTARGA